jgi:acetoin utilization deacetylase AcuC-like enzyme
MQSGLIFVPSSGHTLQGHPEHAGRMAGLWKLLKRHGVAGQVVRLSAETATLHQLLTVHTPEHLAMVEWAARTGGGMIGSDTYVTRSSYQTACQAAGGCCTAVGAVLEGRVRNALALVRPPGHHAGRASVEGFCLFNNVAVAARYAQEMYGIRKVAIIDFDVHHGNGTQEIFWQDETVLFCSVQLVAPYFYPGTGELHEIGQGRGTGSTVNVPLPPGVGDVGYETVFAELLEPFMRAFQPGLLLVSAGFDAHWRDPMAHARLSLTGYDRMVRHLLRWADTWCDGRVVFVLEGGYDAAVLAHGVLNLSRALLGDPDVSDPFGPSPRQETAIDRVAERFRAFHLPA